MSTHEYVKCVTINNSNIPVSKRSQRGLKKTGGCAQLPELQRYIETIIKASNECESEDPTVAEKDKFPKERKFGRQTVYKGCDNKIKHEKVKFDLNLKRPKVRNKQNSPFPETVSSAVDISNRFASGFEDPRNWKLDKTQSLGPSLEIEQFMKKIYPNPYHLENVKELQTGLIFEKVYKDDLRGGTLSDVVISEVDTQIEKRDNALVKPVSDTKQSERKNNSVTHDQRPSSENNNYSSPQIDSNNEDSEISNSLPTAGKSSRKSNSTSNFSSRDSSFDSMSENRKGSRTNFQRKKFVKERKRISSEDNFQNGSKSSLAESQVLSDNRSDYDIGKLKLLNTSDSDDSVPKKLQHEKTEGKDTKSVETNLYDTKATEELYGEMYKSNDLGELIEIYDVMNKATESYLKLSSKTESDHSVVVSRNTGEDKSLLELLNSDNTKIQKEQDDIKLKSEYSEQKINTNSCTENEEVTNNEAVTESVFENKSDNNGRNEEKKTGNSLLNVLLRDEMFGFRCSSREYYRNEPEIEHTNETVESCVKNKEDSKSVSESNSEPQLEEKPNDKDIDSNGKIDEVVQFMYNCLKKIKSQGKLLEEDEKNYSTEDKKEVIKTPSSNKVSKSEKPSNPHLAKKSDHGFSTRSMSDFFAKNFPNTEEINSKYSSALRQIRKKAVTKIRCKGRPELVTSNVQLSENEVSHISYSSHQIPLNCTRSTLTRNNQLELSSVESFDEHVHTAESQNELGAYTEFLGATSISDDSIRIGKAVLPHSVKTNKTKTDTFKVLKDVLETEEKSVANKMNEPVIKKKLNEKSNRLIACKPANQLGINNKSANAFSVAGTFKNPNSKFVVCINSFPRNLRAVASIKPNIPIPPSFSISTTNLIPWTLKPLPYYPKFRLKRLRPPLETKHKVMKFTYNLKQEGLLTVNRSVIAYTAIPFGIKLTINLAKGLEDFSIKMSECSVKVKPMKKSVFVERNSSAANRCCIKSTLTIKSSKSNFVSSSESVVNMKSGDDRPVESFIEAISETEEKMFLLEQSNDSAENLYRNSDSLCSCSTSEMLKNGTSDGEGEKGNDKKKIQDLLLRTYNLQQKLHRYLHKVTYARPTSLSCPFMQQEPLLDIGLIFKEKNDMSCTEFNVKSENSLPLVHWYFQPPVTEITPRASEVKVEKVDSGTSYSPPIEKDSKERNDATLAEVKDEVSQNDNKDDDDDRSSTCSFKSSNDFSEETPNVTKELSDDGSSGNLIKKLFKKIDAFRQNFEADRLKHQEKSDSQNVNNYEGSLNELEQKENRLVEYDTGTPAKVLKTVFKGRKSSTELTIGLKDVPMTKVRNISVEKTKFSPNHTKISICISKEKPNELNHDKINNGIIHDQFSSFYFDHNRPSLSTCQTGFSRLGDDISSSSSSNSSQSLNDESENDDDDDFKSVGSTVENSNSDQREPNPNPKQKPTDEEQKTAKTPQPKNTAKHRFNFYKKMDTDLEVNESKLLPARSPAACRYKELEPLQEALTEMQIRMRSIKRDALLNSNDYYERALKLAKMSAGYCQSCGTRAVIPNDTFGYYKTLIPRRYVCNKGNRHFRTTITPNSNFYSFRVGDAEVGDHFCDLNIKHSSSYLLNRTTHSNRTVLRSSFHDMPILFERI